MKELQEGKEQKEKKLRKEPKYERKERKTKDRKEVKGIMESALQVETQGWQMDLWVFNTFYILLNHIV